MKTLKINWFYALTIIGVIILLSSSCKKDDNTPPPLTMTDIDGNVYNTITIGNQVWTAENLKTTKYNDGTSIPYVTKDTVWGNLITPGYCWLFNDGLTYKYSYGAFYNWYAVNTGKLAPTGWHVPTDAEWNTLITNLGGDSVAGGKMKAITSLWETPNTGATNSSGFSAPPGGSRNANNGFFYLYTRVGNWWSCSEAYNIGVWGYYLSNNSTTVGLLINYKSEGCSVRCVKN